VQNSTAISKFCGKKQIPRLGSKFRGPRKPVGPTDQSHPHNGSATIEASYVNNDYMTYMYQFTGPVQWNVVIQRHHHCSRIIRIMQMMSYWLILWHN